uniref:NAD kinase 2, mitochondrial n=1 Tax=Tetraodon nigroviridis TaxID=99883 RepID=H3C8T4_TETNG
FRPRRVAVVTKTTRYEFEQQRYRYAGLSEEDLKQLLAVKGSSYSGLLERHNIHTSNVEHVVRSLRDNKVEVRVVKRGEYDQGVVGWADAIVSAGGDGTMLLVASKVLSKDKPVVGVNTDPERSQGHLCLPVRYTRAFPEALEKLARGEFRWLWRQRIRLHLEGTGINPTPVDLHEQQLSLEQHSRAHRITTLRGPAEKSSEPRLLPVRGLNEIFIGESLSSRASYYEISVDGGPWEKQKSSGLSICTGTGSKAWSYNINKLGEQAVEEILTTGRSQAGTQLPLDRSFIQAVTERYNASLVFPPADGRLFSVREPIVNRVFFSSRQRGFASRLCVASRCWDACMVVDGGSFEFNDGAIATISTSEEDRLRTVVLDG